MKIYNNDNSLTDEGQKFSTEFGQVIQQFLQDNMEDNTWSELEAFLMHEIALQNSIFRIKLRDLLRRKEIIKT